MSGKNTIYRVAQPSPLLSQKSRKEFIKKGFRIVGCNTFLIDLNKTENELWSGLNKRARWGTRKAKRLGVKVEEATSTYEWNLFQRLHVQHCMKHGHLSSLLAPSILKQIFEVLYPAKMAALFLAKVDNKVVAGTLVLMHRKYTVYFRNASLEGYLRFEPNNLLQWTSIMWGKKYGAKVYDMGGIMPYRSTNSFLYGLYKYKEKWGGQLINYDYYYLGNVYRFLTMLFYRSSMTRKLYNILQRSSAQLQINRI